MSQLSLFDNLWQNTANELLLLLNDGRKGKEIYSAGEAFKTGDKIVITAHNKDSIVLNVLDTNGNIPAGLSACWRSFNHIKTELS